jgi:Tfp pilus assembly protein FimV
MKYTLVLLSLVISVGYAAEQKQYQTTAGDSLSNILRSQNYGQTYADIKPYFAEVIKLNPHAFKDGNPNQMIPGAVLTLPANPNAIETAPDSAPELVATPEPEPAAEPEPEPGSETGPAAETEASIVGRQTRFLPSRIRVQKSGLPTRP